MFLALYLFYVNFTLLYKLGKKPLFPAPIKLIYSAEQLTFFLRFGNEIYQNLNTDFTIYYNQFEVFYEK